MTNFNTFKRLIQPFTDIVHGIIHEVNKSSSITKALNAIKEDPTILSQHIDIEWGKYVNNPIYNICGKKSFYEDFLSRYKKIYLRKCLVTYQCYHLQ